ncbi:hypothetical protein HOG21_01885 [bacterium]|jgi:hypothetical protein|nr:hypothetical protein [bacterium]
MPKNTTNKQNKKPVTKSIKKDNKYKPFLILLSISLIITLLLPYIKEKETYIDKDIALNQLELNYSK